MRKTSPRITRLIETARNHVGVRSRAQKVNPYGALTGHDGQAWSGSFLETVMRESGENTQPNFVSTTAALAEYIRLGSIYSTPKPGDIAFLSYSTDHIFAQPNVALVTDTSAWKTDGVFRAVAGQIASGLPKGPQDDDGVYERNFYGVDVLAFARPRYRDRPGLDPASATSPVIDAAAVVPGKKNKSVVAVQQALHQVTGATGMTRGVYDSRTKNSVSRYQRTIGYLSAPGILDEVTLRRLALDTEFKYFRL